MNWRVEVASKEMEVVKLRLGILDQVAAGTMSTKEVEERLRDPSSQYLLA